jgi:hypothetical protein
VMCRSDFMGETGSVAIAEFADLRSAFKRAGLDAASIADGERALAEAANVEGLGQLFALMRMYTYFAYASGELRDKDRLLRLTGKILR